MTPGRILRLFQDLPASVLAKLPDRVNSAKQVQRERLKEMPSNPQSIQELEEIPDKYKVTKVGENFLLYDSYEDEEYNLTCCRIIIYATLDNLRKLFKSAIWFVDGTFKVDPSIFSNFL